MAPTLLPCPFCGSDKVSINTERDSDDFGVFIFVSCGKCRAQSGSMFTSEVCPKTYQEVRDLWNTRLAPTEPKLNKQHEE